MKSRSAHFTGDASENLTQIIRKDKSRFCSSPSKSFSVAFRHSVYVALSAFQVVFLSCEEKLSYGWLCVTEFWGDSSGMWSLGKAGRIITLFMHAVEIWWTYCFGDGPIIWLSLECAMLLLRRRLGCLLCPLACLSKPNDSDPFVLFKHVKSDSELVCINITTGLIIVLTPTERFSIGSCLYDIKIVESLQLYTRI